MLTRAAKRRRQQMDDDTPSTTQPSPSPCLLPLLQPVRPCFQQLLSTEDAVRLMRASRSLTAALLTNYAYVDHVFTYSHAADVKRSLAFYARYSLQPLRLCLPEDWDESLVDSETGQPLLPRSLVALALGRLEQCSFDALDVGGHREAGRKESIKADGGREGQLGRLTRQWETANHADMWDIPKSWCWAPFNRDIPPAALPRGLRYLHFNEDFNQPIAMGSIPDTVEVLIFGRDFDQLLEVGHLPASLIHLYFGAFYSQPLMTGVLPAGLQRLHLGGYDCPLPAGLLPPQLRQISFGDTFTQALHPGDLPPFVTHVRFDGPVQPLQPGSIPEGVEHFNLGRFGFPLQPGVLPASLRELVLGQHYEEALQPGCLPHGLEVLLFDKRSMFQQPLQPGIIPAGVSVVSMGQAYAADLVDGGIPSTVKWLRLPTRYAGRDLSGVLSSSTRVVYWRERGLEN